jgi:hypothetical protein
MVFRAVDIASFRAFRKIWNMIFLDDGGTGNLKHTPLTIFGITDGWTASCKCGRGVGRPFKE